MMQFDEFVRDLDSVVHETSADARLDAADAKATWTAGARTAEIAVLAPHNVSVALSNGGTSMGTTWYPIDKALVPTVSRRIASHLTSA